MSGGAQRRQRQMAVKEARKAVLEVQTAADGSAKGEGEKANARSLAQAEIKDARQVTVEMNAERAKKRKRARVVQHGLRVNSTTWKGERCSVMFILAI